MIVKCITFKILAETEERKIIFKGFMIFHGMDFRYLSTGETPLIHAVRQGHTSTAKYLLECGANPAIPSDLGATALHHSAGIGVFLNF